MIKIDDIVLHEKSECSHNSKDELLTLYWRSHPRFNFLKFLPYGAKLLDIGAGSGGLIFWKKWKRPIRDDLRMYALDIVANEIYNNFEDYQICNLNVQKTKFPDSFFNALMLSHVVEHLNNIDFVFNEIFRILKSKGRIYFEFPTPHTIYLPKNVTFKEKGINVTITNFFDDNTHRRTYDFDQFINILEDTHFRLTNYGVVRNYFLENQLLSQGIKMNDPELITYGVWSQLEWAQYYIVQKK